MQRLLVDLVRRIGSVFDGEREIEMKRFRIAVGVALVLCAVTTAFGVSVKSDYDKNFDFSQLKIYSFKTDRGSNDPLKTDTIQAKRIQDALAAQLGAKGYTESTQEPDFIVAFYAHTKEKTRVESDGPTFGFGPGFGWGYGIPYRDRWRWGFGPDIWTDTYTQGCVMVDIIDRRNSELVWRGVVMDTVNGLGQSEKQANEAAKALVERFVKDGNKVDKKAN